MIKTLKMLTMIKRMEKLMLFKSVMHTRSCMYTQVLQNKSTSESKIQNQHLGVSAGISERLWRDHGFGMSF